MKLDKIIKKLNMYTILTVALSILSPISSYAGQTDTFQSDDEEMNEEDTDFSEDEEETNEEDTDFSEDEEKIHEIEGYRSSWDDLGEEDLTYDTINKNVPGWYKDDSGLYDRSDWSEEADKWEPKLVSGEDYLYTITDNKNRKWYICNNGYHGTAFFFSSDPRKNGARAYPGIIDFKNHKVIIWYKLYSSGEYDRINPYDLTKTMKEHQLYGLDAAVENDNISDKDKTASYDNISENVSQPEARVSVGRKSYQLHKDGTAHNIKYNKKYRKADIKKIFDIKNKKRNSYISYKGYLYQL